MKNKDKNIILTFILKNKLKSLILFFGMIGLVSFIGAWIAVSGGHDKQNKLILFFKSIIPTPVYQKKKL